MDNVNDILKFEFKVVRKNKYQMSKMEIESKTKYLLNMLVSFKSNVRSSCI